MEKFELKYKGKLKSSTIKRLKKQIDIKPLCAQSSGSGEADIIYAYKKAINKAEIFAFYNSIDTWNMPKFVSVNLFIPLGSDERNIKKITDRMYKLVSDDGYVLAGIHSEVSKTAEDYMYTFTVFGNNNPLDSNGNACAGNDEMLVNDDNELTCNMDEGCDNKTYLVMTAFAGISGSSYIYKKYRDRLDKRFSSEYLMAFEKYESWLDSSDHVKAVFETNKRLGDVAVIDTLGSGGLYGRLMDIVDKNSAFSCFNRGKFTGFDVDLKKVPIKQETVEICNYLDINPYMMASEGSIIFAANNPDEYIKELENKGIYAAVIGTLTNDNQKIIRIDEDIKYIDPFKKDIIKNVID